MSKEVEIPEKWYEVFEKRAREKGLDSGEEYVHYVLQQTYEKLKDDSEGNSYTEEEEEKVKDRLEDLGYLD